MLIAKKYLSNHLAKELPMCQQLNNSLNLPNKIKKLFEVKLASVGCIDVHWANSKAKLDTLTTNPIPRSDDFINLFDSSEDEDDNDYEEPRGSQFLISMINPRLILNTWMRFI